MKSCLAIIYTCLFVVHLQAQDIRVEPPFWWEEMAHDTLQLMVHGQDIQDWKVEVSSKNKHIKLIKVHQADSPSYLFLDIWLSPNAKNSFDIVFYKKSLYMPKKLEG